MVSTKIVKEYVITAMIPANTEWLHTVSVIYIQDVQRRSCSLSQIIKL